MRTINNMTLLTISEAARILGLQPHSVYRAVRHGKLKVEKILGLQYIRSGEVIEYYPRRKKIRSLAGQSPGTVTGVYINFNDVCAKLAISPYRLKKLIANKMVDAYCTPSGEVMVSELDTDKLITGGSKNDAERDIDHASTL